MQTSTFALGPGALQGSSGSPFEISLEQWQNIHVFLTNVNSTTPETTAQFIRLMPTYGDLEQAAGVWRATTFPNLIQLSQGIVDYNRDTVRVTYPKLDAIAGRWQTDAPTAGDKAEFDAIISTSVANAQRNAEAATPVVHDLQALTDAVEATSNEAQSALSTVIAGAYGGGGASTGDLSDELVSRVEQIAGSIAQIASILSVLGTPPVTDIERVRGAWGAVSDDLDRLKAWVLSEIAGEQPFIAQLNVEVAMGEWDTLAAEAQAFAQSARGLLAH